MTDFRRLDLNLLLVLDAMFEERRTTAVARRLKVSQPTVSFSLRKLREFFGDDLFIRAGSRMQPTAFAETLHDPVRRIVEVLRRELLHAEDFDPATSTRIFTLSLSDIGELVFLPLLLTALRREAPQASIRCLSMPPHELEDALAQGEVDLALGYFPDLAGTNFLEQKLFEHRFTCLVSAQHRDIGEALTLERFLAADHAVVMQEGRSQEIFERRMSELRLERRILLRSPHFMTVPLMVAHSDMITTVPLAVGLAYARLVPVRLFEPPIDIPPIELKQIWHRRASNDAAAAWLRQLVSRLFLDQDPSATGDGPIFACP